MGQCARQETSALGFAMSDPEDEQEGGPSVRSASLLEQRGFELAVRFRVPTLIKRTKLRFCSP